MRSIEMAILLWATLGLAPLRALVEVHILPDQGQTILAIGDTVTFEIWMDPHGLRLTGYDIYLTFDPEVFKPIFTDTTFTVSNGDTTFIFRPFSSTGELILSGPLQNDTRGDVWATPYLVDVNRLAGFQLDYSQHTPACGGCRQSFSHSGVAATFRLTVIGIPPAGPATITFDNQYIIPTGGARETGFYPLTGDEAKRDFDILGNLNILVAGLKILPALPDTTINPGETLRLRLADYFLSGLYTPAQVTWSLTVNSTPGATSAVLDLSDTSLVVATTALDQGIADLTLLVTSNDFLYSDSQNLQVIVDWPPVFTPPFPSLQFDEDDSLVVAGSAIFSDLDDTGPDISVRLEPAAPIRVRYDEVAETIAFSADLDWFGSAQSRLFVEDALGVSIDTLLDFTVNSINDPPVVSFDSVSALGDTIVIHYGQTATLDLDSLVIDVENAPLSWSHDDPDPAHLSVSLVAGHILSLEPVLTDPIFYGDIDLTITATDDSAATGSDTLVVSIRSWPPEIGALPEIKLLAGTPDTLALNPLVSDNDTPDAAMTWTFAVTNFLTGAADFMVSVNYDQPTQTVIFNAPVNYAASDWLELTVTDDDNNSDIDSTRLTVFATLNPVIDPLDTVVVFRDTSTQVLDLDDFVIDPIYNDADMSWSYLGGDSLQAVLIDPVTHVVTLVTNPNFFGWDSVRFIAANPGQFTDSSTLTVRVIPRFDLSPLWSPLESAEIVPPDTIHLFNLASKLKDDFTAFDQLVTNGFVLDPATGAVDNSLLTLTIDPATSLAWIEVPSAQTMPNYTVWLYFSAQDDMGQVSNSDTMVVAVRDSYSPVWTQPPSVAMLINETFSGLFLQDYLSDRDTPLGSLTITFVNPNPLITVTYNAATTEVTIQASGVASESRVTFTATDAEGNSTAIQLRVFVRAITDFDAPEGGLTYLFNPVADKWINFVLVSDSTTDRIKTTYIYNSREVPLSFSQQDSLPGAITWVAPYRFEFPGVYNMSAELIDNVNNVNRLFIRLNVAFAKARGQRQASPDQLLTVAYPPQPGGNGKLMIVSEQPASAELIKRLESQGAFSRSNRPSPNTYILDTNLPKSTVVTLTFQQSAAADPYFSFYQAEVDRLVRIDTYTSREGKFEAVVTPGTEILFGPSDTPASRDPLPGEELYCYPNPFNAAIQVRFMLRGEDRGRILIYDLLGREVYATPHQRYRAGIHSFTWHGLDSRGSAVPSGLYFVRLMTDGGRLTTQKVTLLK
ncbi:MAG: T9SS type A sorting domain-containing protein [Candidatus Marinimicrobia bacterium]|nr:T9SS type A sorting domain-containing protein [Candidatus Neomarinimicrobiota bacterium]